METIANISKPTLPIKTRLMTNGIWAFAGKIITALTTFGTNALLARLVSAHDLGAFFLVFSLASIVSVIAQAGMSQAVVRLIAEALGTVQHNKIKATVLTTLKFCTGSGILAGVCLYSGVGKWIALHAMKSEEIGRVMWLVSIWIPLLTFQSVVAEVFRGFHNIKLASFLSGGCLGILTFIALGISLLLKLHFALPELLIVCIALSTMTALVSFLLIRRQITSFKSYTPVEAKSILVIALPLFLINIVIQLTNQADLWIIGIFKISQDVAIYGAVVRLATAITFITSLGYAVIPPIAVELFVTHQMKKLEQVIRAVATVSTIVALPILIAFICYASSILGIVYGATYSSGGKVLRLLSVGLFLNVLTGIRGYLLLLVGYEWLQLKISLVFGILGVLFCLICVKNFGIEGVAFAMTLSTILQAITETLVVKKVLGIWTHISFVKSFEIFLSYWVEIKGKTRKKA